MKDEASPVVGAMRQRLATGFAWNLVGAVFNQGSTFAVNIVVANLLGRPLFGSYAIVQGMIVTLTAVGQLSSGYTATKYVAEYRSASPERAGRVLGLCVLFSSVLAAVLSLALAVSAGIIAERFLKEPALRGPVIIGSAAVLFGIVSGVMTGGLNGLEAYRASGLAGVASGTLYVTACSFGAWAAGVRGAVIGLAVSGFAQSMILAVALRREAARRGLPLTGSGMWGERRVLLAFSLPAAIAGVLFPAALWLSNVLLARGTGYEQVALYSASNNLRVLVLFVPLVLNAVSSSLLNQSRGVGDWGAYARIFQWNLRLTFLLVVTGALFLLVSGPFLLSIFGPSFREGYPVLVLLALSTVPEGISLAAYQVVQTEAAMWRSLFAIAVPRDVLLLALTAGLAPHYGAMGLAVAYGLAWTIACLLTGWVSWQIFPARYRCGPSAT